jgi:alpha,alpha-trehalase
MRESGEDTTYRLVNRAARMNPVSLNSLLFFVESRLGVVLDDVFGGSLTLSSGEVVTSVDFSKLASQRRDLMNSYLWDDELGVYLDYVLDNQNSPQGERLKYLSANCFYPLWAGLATQEQADRTVRFAIARLEQPGGLSATDEYSPGTIDPEHPQRQWDYPFGWAPHQMIAWKGLTQYGHGIQAQELMYRWVHMVIVDSMRNNGALAEKYDVVNCSQQTSAEYGNECAGIGVDRSGAGFGWTNASIQYALTQLNVSHQRALLKLLVPSTLFGQAAGQEH